MTLKLEDVRRHAVQHTLFAPTTLKKAIARLGFVQADPIRAPARAQDLILRLRVQAYRAGDLEQRYPELNIEEGYLYAYGFLLRPLWQMRHPPNRRRLTAFEKRLLAAVERLGAVHPDVLRKEFGRARAINAWGSYSSVTKLALERLHHRGLLRIARRDKGIRVYEPCPPLLEQPAPSAVFERLLLTVASILAPLSERSLSATLAPLRRRLRGVPATPRLITTLLASGKLHEATADGVRYLWPAPLSRKRAPTTAPPAAASEARVTFLAPFDPLVWDRRRFEHLWGWPYRFEAYTPLAKRVRGYYALPLLYRADVIGWANVKNLNPGIDVELGFVNSRPRERAFTTALDAEIERMRVFLATAPAAPESIE